MLGGAAVACPGVCRGYSRSVGGSSISFAWTNVMGAALVTLTGLIRPFRPLWLMPALPVL